MQGKVAALMSRRPVTIGADESVAAARERVAHRGIHHLLVVDERGSLVGVVSDRDVLRAVSPFAESGAERNQDRYTLRRPVHQIMSRAPVTVSPEAGVLEAARRMLEKDYGCVPVVDSAGRPVGIVTRKDILGALVAGTGAA